MNSGNARAWRPLFRGRSFVVGTLLGVALTTAIGELPYLNWREVAAPVDAQPLTVRHDAKGDGRFAVSRSGNRRHRGIDLAAPLDSPVRAIRSGTVVQVGLHKGLGHVVEVEHRRPFDFAQGRHLRSLYAHLNAVHVAVGDRVRQGQVIGAVGKTGNAKHPWITPHVHLEVRQDGVPIDPQLVGLRVVDPALGLLAVSDADGGE